MGAPATRRVGRATGAWTSPEQQEADVLVVQCPQVSSGRRLVGERRILGLRHAYDGFVLTVLCPCGARHEVHVGGRPLAPSRTR